MNTTIKGENGWVFVQDVYGDWRGTNEALGLRTRLKRDTRGEGARSGLDWVRHDITIRRLQRFDGGQWVDKIDHADPRSFVNKEREQ